MADFAKIAALANAIVAANMTSISPSPAIEDAARAIVDACRNAAASHDAAEPGVTDEKAGAHDGDV